ncbi:hypothetical protein AAFF_G00371760 [Aldrovandia affinis]|uniref:Uncharacterized protein n=1 Tax=Aldrovandia affinis TaxID=143900 RepID=A0AAD7WMA4_9TELE|nr:hypothetical protein AAFF_G00371760 [Aldrovandia affinis]
MQRTYTCAGSQPPCRILVVALLFFLYFLTAEASLEVESPKIVKLHQKKQAEPGFLDDFTLIYWLVNRTFIETAYPDGRVYEAEEGAIEKKGKILIQRDLIFKRVLLEDFRASYTCIVNNSAGRDKQTYRLSE